MSTDTRGGMRARTTGASSSADPAWALRYADPDRSRALARELPRDDIGRAVLELFASWRALRLTEALDLLDGLSDRPELVGVWRVRAYNIRANIFSSLGLAEQALRSQLDELALAEELGDPVAIAGVVHDLGVSFEVSDPPRAAEQYLEALRLARGFRGRTPDLDRESLCLEALAAVNLRDVDGRYGVGVPDGVPTVAEAADLVVDAWPDLRHALLAGLASQAAEEGDVERAHALLAGVPAAQSVRDVVCAGEVARGQAVVAQVDGDPEAAVAILTRLLERLPPARAQEVLGTLADIRARQGDHEGAFALERERVHRLMELHAVDTRSAVLALEVWHRTRRAEQAARVAQAELARERDRSGRDGLTGLGNRRLLGRSARGAGDGPYQLALLDVDRFKTINDTAGHLAGDRALVAVADALRAVARPDDVCVRYGGDEFIVLRPGREGSEAHDLALDLAPLVRLAPGEDSPAVSTSIGVVHARDDVESALDRADRLMYRAKQRGGGAVVTESEVRGGGRAAVRGDDPDAG